MSAAVTEQHDEDGHPNLGACAYAQGVGSCSFGCWEEPSCMTDCPREGWPPLNLHPMHEQNLRARRLGHRIENWLGWLPVRYGETHREAFSSRFPNRHEVVAWLNQAEKETG